MYDLLLLLTHGLNRASKNLFLNGSLTIVDSRLIATADDNFVDCLFIGGGGRLVFHRALSNKRGHVSLSSRASCWRRTALAVFSGPIGPSLMSCGSASPDVVGVS